jgi:multiple sugar transport system permease protein
MRQRWWMAPATGKFTGTSSSPCLGFLAGWGNYLWPLLTTHSPDYWPIMVGLSYFRNQSPQVPAQIMAFSSMVVIPVLIVFGLFQKWFIRSIASTGIKG